MHKSSSCCYIWTALGDALWCYGCARKGCSGRREECGSLLRNPVCATIDARKNFIYNQSINEAYDKIGTCKYTLYISIF